MKNTTWKPKEDEWLMHEGLKMRENGITNTKIAEIMVEHNIIPGRTEHSIRKRLSQKLPRIKKKYKTKKRKTQKTDNIKKLEGLFQTRTKLKEQKQELDGNLKEVEEEIRSHIK